MYFLRVELNWNKKTLSSTIAKQLNKALINDDCFDFLQI